MWDLSDRSTESFNPLPPSKRGETDGLRKNEVVDIMFQSAPPVETRGDPSLIFRISTSTSFQSAPPVETRGDVF